MAIEVFNRYEHKYILDRETFKKVIEVMDAHMILDASHEANDAIRLKDSDGNVVYEYTPNGKFSAILISGDKLTIGESYTLTVGEETHTVTIAEKTTVVGTSKAGNMGIGGRAPHTQQ